MLDNFSIFTRQADDVPGAPNIEQAVTVTALSTKAVNVGSWAGRRREPVNLEVRVTEAFLTCTSVAVEIHTSATESGTYVKIASTAAVVFVELIVGYKFKLQFLPDIQKPWVKLQFVVAGSNATAGKIFAHLPFTPDATWEDGLFFSPKNTSGAAATANP